VIVTTSYDGTARVWDPLDPSQELARFDGHTGEVWEAATLGWPDLDHQVIVTASGDRTARVWDPLDRRREPSRFDGHAGLVWRVAALDWC
jgi:WD40 repeat protein